MRGYRDGTFSQHKGDHNNLPDLWTLKGVRVPQSWNKLKHEMDCVNLLGAYKNGADAKGKALQHWDNKWSERELGMKIKSYRIDYDRRMVLDDKVFLIEVDRGTEELKKQVYPKVDKYLEIMRDYPKDTFFVVFTMQYKRYRNTTPKMEEERIKERCKDLLRYLHSKNTGVRFLVARHKDVLADPLGRIYSVPTQAADISLLDLQVVSKLL